VSEYAITLVGAERREAARVVAQPHNGLCRIELHYLDRVLEATARDYFEAFCQVREQLEPEHLIPFCYGASVNVFPSGMSRDMGGGLGAYRCQSGQRASRDDLVDIFASGDDVMPSSVAQQKKYHDLWIQSIQT
jgi:hypothetical protein